MRLPLANKAVGTSSAINITKVNRLGEGPLEKLTLVGSENHLKMIGQT